MGTKLSNIKLSRKTADSPEQIMGEKENSEAVKQIEEETQKLPYDYLASLVIVGDQGVGKSAMCSKVVNNEYLKDYIWTIGLDFFDVLIPFSSDNCTSLVMKYSLWDTPGYKNDPALQMIKPYMQRKDAILLCYDITNRDSFDNIQRRWYKYVQQVSPYSVYILIGMKCDLIKQRQVLYEEGQKLAEELQIPPSLFLETSMYCDGSRDDERNYVSVVKGFVHEQRAELFSFETRYNVPDLVMDCILRYYSYVRKLDYNCVNMVSIFEDLALYIANHSVKVS